MVTVDDLTLAIKNSIDDSHAMVEEQAYELAHHVLNFFGYSDRIIDNVLEPEDRDAFYMLEDGGILTTEREETTLYDGREWRIHYWLFKRDKIADLMVNARRKVKDEGDEEFVYSDLPDDVWQRGGGEAE
ncbi:MAG: hypothetical protein J6W53_04390 [Candidatus Methanomethylophilaceae archaeon]|nr:hypothetical protein [Candidatus Methanomethylophilaceae archaeon]